MDKKQICGVLGTLCFSVIYPPWIIWGFALGSPIGRPFSLLQTAEGNGGECGATASSCIYLASGRPVELRWPAPQFRVGRLHRRSVLHERPSVSVSRSADPDGIAGRNAVGKVSKERTSRENALHGDR